jgi:hypothetical protein
MNCTPYLISGNVFLTATFYSLKDYLKDPVFFFLNPFPQSVMNFRCGQSQMLMLSGTTNIVQQHSYFCQVFPSFMVRFERNLNFQMSLDLGPVSV